MFTYALQFPNCSRLLLYEIATSKCVLILIRYNANLEFCSRGDSVAIHTYPSMEKKIFY